MHFPEVYLMNENFLCVFMKSQLDFDIPKSLEFKIAFIIATILYIVAMAVLFMLYRKALKKLPEELRNHKKVKKQKKDKLSSDKNKSIRSK